jgi:hypothetical protein
MKLPIPQKCKIDRPYGIEPHEKYDDLGLKPDKSMCIRTKILANRTSNPVSFTFLGVGQN